MMSDDTYTPDQTEASENDASSSIHWGLFLWLCFAPIAVAIRGVRWAENYEFAQVLLGVIPYPESHPLNQYLHIAFSLQTSVVAAIMSVTPSALIANGYQNILFVMATTIPVYLLGSLLTGRALWGHVAALLVLMEIHVNFYSTYPIAIWPVMGTNGATGVGFAFLALYGIASGRLWLAYIIMGLLPSIHVGQIPPVWSVGGLYILHLAYKGERARIVAAAKAFGIGLSATILFFLYYRTQTLPPPSSGPYYFPEIDPHILWNDFMTYFASHRAFPWGTGHIMMACAVVYSLVSFAVERKRDHPSDAINWIVIYIFAVTVLVWGTMLIHAVMGQDIPYVLISWIPYRLINHMGPILIVLMLGTLIRHRMGVIPALILLIGAVRPFLPFVFGDELVTRYLNGGEGLFLGMFGCSIALLMADLREQQKVYRVFGIVLILAWCALAYVHQFGAASALLGFGVARFAREPLGLIPEKFLLQVSCICFTVVLLGIHWSTRTHLPITDFEKRVTQYLDDEGKPNAMIAVHYMQYESQGRLHHPVTSDMATMTMVPYAPSIRPGVYKLYRDLYGLNLAPSIPGAPASQPWYEVWPAKQESEWIALSNEYGFEYVLASGFMTLDLPLLFEGAHDKFYYIPVEPPSEL